MEEKPVIMCHGDQTLISKLHSYIKHGLPREVVEWRRSFGRPARKINVDCKFCPFDVEQIPKNDNWTLLSRPFFHIFFTECDIEAYKSSVKDEISNWMTALKSRSIADWLILVVVYDESKVKTKILRTSIIDKVKNDFCGKQPERCTVLQEPFRSDSKSSESWNKLFMLMRQLIVQSFNTTLNRFEEHMREQREKRQEASWSFNNYFLLQEELAFMFEMLGLYEDALVQYDELDALFTQFLLNHSVGDTAIWMNAYVENVPQRWDSISLSQPIDVEKRNRIREDKASLLDFRNYLFLRQSTLLFLLLRPWEVSKRAVPFILNCLQEIKVLQVQLQQGGSACWVFLTCLEILHTCESFTSSGKMDPYSLHMAVLWDYARKKLYDLGDLCGLLPDASTTSYQLNMVVDLIAGFVRYADTEPLIKLREALSSKKSFRQHYLELSELAMGSFKHIGRVRSAMLISKDLAEFYMKSNEPQKAEAYLMGILKIQMREKWCFLIDDIRLNLARCQKHLEHNEQYCHSCVHLTASPAVDSARRKHFQAEMLRMAAAFTDNNRSVPSMPLFQILEVRFTHNSYLVGEHPCVQVNIHLNALEAIHCDFIAVALTPAAQDFTTKSVKQHQRQLSGPIFSPVTNAASEDFSTSRFQQTFAFSKHIEYSANKKRLTSCSLKSDSNLRYSDIGDKDVLKKDIKKIDYATCLSERDLEFKPGGNRITLTDKLTEAGFYRVSQLCIRVKGLEFLEESIASEEVAFQIRKVEPRIELKCQTDTLWAGIEQNVTIALQNGAGRIENTALRFGTTDGLTVFAEGTFQHTTEIPIETESSEGLRIPLKVFCDSQNRDESISEQIAISCEDLGIMVERELVFHQPLSVSHKLHDCGKRKFLQLLVQSAAPLDFVIASPILTWGRSDVEQALLNNASKVVVINQFQWTSFMWEIDRNIQASKTRLECIFSVQFSPKLDDTKDFFRRKSFRIHLGSDIL